MLNYYDSKGEVVGFNYADNAATAPAIGASAAATTVGASVTPEILMIIIPIAAEFSKAA